jgi:hypothetical protein
VKDFYKENYKPLKKDTEDYKINMKRSPMLMDLKNQHSKNVYITKSILQVQNNLIKIPMTFITETEKSFGSTKDH